MCLQLVCISCSCDLGRRGYKPCKRRPRSGYIPQGARECPFLVRRPPSSTGSEGAEKCVDCIRKEEEEEEKKKDAARNEADLAEAAACRSSEESGASDKENDDDKPLASTEENRPPPREQAVEGESEEYHPEQPGIQREHRPLEQVKIRPREESVARPTPSTQPITERVPRKRTAAPIKTDTNYARPGDLFNEGTWRRVADVVGKTRVGEEIASVTRAMEAKNDDANGCFKDRLKEDELFRGRGVVRRETATVEAKEGAACASGGGKGRGGTGETTDDEGRKK
ncbi:MAG: hypothetical protein Q9164_004268 [Protoblastenia rupestris]